MKEEAGNVHVFGIGLPVDKLDLSGYNAGLRRNRIASVCEREANF